MIILEGFDNSGKSTLAKRFGLEVIHPGPAPKTKSEELGCLMSQHSYSSKPIVHDRVTCISSQVYQGKVGDVRYMAWLKAMLSTPHCLLIYCRPPMETIIDMRQHEAKKYDTPEHLDKIARGASHFVEQYDALMSLVPHYRYDWTRTQINIDEFKQALVDFDLWNTF